MSLDAAILSLGAPRTGLARLISRIGSFRASYPLGWTFGWDIRRAGSSIPSDPSPGLKRSSPISAARPTASPSPTVASSPSTTTASPFRWKDYRAKGRERMKVMTLAGDEFIRRFLIHVLPSGFHRIRHYGL